MSSPYGKWRTGKKVKDNDHHGGQDYARGLGKVGNQYNMYAQTDSTITQESFMALVFQRRGIPDRIAHLHLNHDSREGAVGRVLQGTKLANPLQYGTAFKSVGEVIGRLSGRGDSEHSYATHEHIEYHVLARDPRVGVRILSKNGQAIKGNTTHFRSRNLLSKGMTLRQISPTPYLAHDTPLQGGIAGFASAYVGNTAFTYYNAIYRTQLPAGLFAPATMGTPSKQGSFVAGKGLPVTLFNGSAYAGMDISLNALGDINSAILGDTVAFESAGFELGGGTYVTQRMLASHFADDNGESWTSLFGNADSASVSEMSEQELVAYIANKRYANDEWRSGLVKLSTKGLLTEYLNAKAETNYLLEKIAEQEMKLMAQEALLARVRMNHKDKELESLTEAINVGVAPDFIKAELEKKGDEWIESEVQTGGFGGDGGYSGGAPIDMANLPDDINALHRALLEAISGHESNGSYNAFNDGTNCGKKLAHTKPNPHPFAPITQMTPQQMLQRYYGAGYYPKDGLDTSNAVRCGHRLFAVGKYQWIPKTLNDMIRQPQFKEYLTKPFTPEVQEKLALAYFAPIKRKDIATFLRTGQGKREAQKAIAYEWASIAMPAGESIGKVKGGKPSRGCISERVCDSFYGSGNRAFYESTMKVWAILDKIEQVHKNKK